MEHEIADFLAEEASDKHWRTILWLWLTGLVGPFIVLVAIVRPYWSSRSMLAAVIGALTAAAVSTIVFGFILSQHRQFNKNLRAIIYGTVAVVLCYDIAMVTFNPNDPTSDNAAGAAVAIFLIPTAATIAVLLFIGEGMGIVLSKLLVKPAKDQPQQ